MSIRADKDFPASHDFGANTKNNRYVKAAGTSFGFFACDRFFAITVIVMLMPVSAGPSVAVIVDKFYVDISIGIHTAASAGDTDAYRKWYVPHFDGVDGLTWYTSHIKGFNFVTAANDYLVGNHVNRMNFDMLGKDINNLFNRWFSPRHAHSMVARFLFLSLADDLVDNHGGRAGRVAIPFIYPRAGFVLIHVTPSYVVCSIICRRS